MSFEELMNVEIDVGTLTSTQLYGAPVAITTITREDIKYTPKRNLYDLIEIYVPGAIWMNHTEGPHIGMRGIIVDRNYKFLLLINGRNLNQKAHNGATSELENWDLDDIEKIEIIRGPGSVIYGSGAIMAVINIITKNAKNTKGTHLSTNYVSSYNSMGVSFSHSLRNKDFDFYIHSSITKTYGFTPESFVVYAGDNTAGYIGKDFKSGRVINPPLDYFRDFDDLPQIKTYMELQFLKDWTLWARYTNSGSSNFGVSSTGFNTKVRFQNGFSLDSITTDIEGESIYHRSPRFGQLDNFKMNRIRHFIISLENNHYFLDAFNLFDKFHLKTLISWDSHDYERRAFLSRFKNYKFSDPVEIKYAISDRNNVRYKMVNFAENEFFAKLLANIKYRDNYKAAFGIEYSYDYFGSGWNDDIRDFRMGDSHTIISDSTSNAYGYTEYGGTDPEKANFVGNGWGMHTISVLGELNFKFHPLFTLLLSARYDKNSFAKLLFSPRLAFVSELDKKTFLKFSIQKSERLNTAEQLFIQHRQNIKSNPEKLNGFECLFTKLLKDNFFFSTSGFFNEIQILAWSDGRNTKLKGDLSLYGFEVEARYSSEKLSIGLNHSYVKQIDWKLAQDEQTSGISYSDFYKDTGDGIILTGTGNDLNNWSNHSTKWFARCKLFDDKLIIHADARAFWDFKGAKDVLIMLKTAATGTDKEEEINNAISMVNKQHTYDVDFRFNLSATLSISEYLSITTYIMNLIGIGNNKRYAYDAGVKYASPHRVAFVEEPRIYGVKLDVEL
jgi:outer membrane cobalamin receptor